MHAGNWIWDSWEAQTYTYGNHSFKTCQWPVDTGILRRFDSLIWIQTDCNMMHVEYSLSYSDNVWLQRKVGAWISAHQFKYFKCQTTVFVVPCDCRHLQSLPDWDVLLKYIAFYPKILPEFGGKKPRTHGDALNPFPWLLLLILYRWQSEWVSVLYVFLKCPSGLCHLVKWIYWLHLACCQKLI